MVGKLQPQSPRLHAVNEIIPALEDLLPRRIAFRLSSQSNGSIVTENSQPKEEKLPVPKKLLCSTDKILDNLPWKETIRIGAGFSNLGNTCFLNSVLQCLTYTPAITNYCKSKEHSRSCRTMGFCMLCRLENLVHRAVSNPGGVISPRDIVTNLRCIARHFRPGRQEDAHEFVRFVIEHLQKCFLAMYAKTDPISSQTTYIHQIFGGWLQSQIRCLECDFKSNTFDPFMDLSLDLNHADSVHKALRRFTAAEKLDGDNKYMCSKCRKKVTAKKQLTVHVPPPVLTVHLKRFGFHRFGSKIDKMVQYNETLDLSDFCTAENISKEGGPLYELYGVVVHLGHTTHSGHYYCYVKAPSGIWYQMDDSSVSQVSQNRVLRERAYILFYRMKNPHRHLHWHQHKKAEQKAQQQQNKPKSFEKVPDKNQQPQAVEQSLLSRSSLGGASSLTLPSPATPTGSPKISSEKLLHHAQIQQPSLSSKFSPLVNKTSTTTQNSTLRKDSSTLSDKRSNGLSKHVVQNTVLPSPHNSASAKDSNGVSLLSGSHLENSKNKPPKDSSAPNTNKRKISESEQLPLRLEEPSKNNPEMSKLSSCIQSPSALLSSPTVHNSGHASQTKFNGENHPAISLSEKKRQMVHTQAQTPSTVEPEGTSNSQNVVATESGNKKQKISSQQSGSPSSPPPSHSHPLAATATITLSKQKSLSNSRIARSVLPSLLLKYRPQLRQSKKIYIDPTVRTSEHNVSKDHPSLIKPSASGDTNLPAKSDPTPSMAHQNGDHGVSFLATTHTNTPNSNHERKEKVMNGHSPTISITKQEGSNITSGFNKTSDSNPPTSNTNSFRDPDSSSGPKVHTTGKTKAPLSNGTTAIPISSDWVQSVTKSRKSIFQEEVATWEEDENVSIEKMEQVRILEKADISKQSKQRRKRDEYNDEYDQGKVKKLKKHKHFLATDKFNPFQVAQNIKLGA